MSGYEWIRVDTSGYEWIRVDTSGYEWMSDENYVLLERPDCQVGDLYAGPALLVGRNVYGVYVDERRVRFATVTVRARDAVRLGTLKLDHMAVELFTAAEFSVVGREEISTMDNRFWWIDEYIAGLIKKMLGGQFSQEDAQNIERDGISRRICYLMSSLVYSGKLELVQLIRSVRPELFRSFIQDNLPSLVYYPQRMFRGFIFDLIGARHRMTVLSSFIRDVPTDRRYYGVELAVAMFGRYKDFFTNDANLAENIFRLNALTCILHEFLRPTSDEPFDPTGLSSAADWYGRILQMMRQYMKQLSTVYVPNLIALAHVAKFSRNIVGTIREFI